MAAAARGSRGPSTTSTGSRALRRRVRGRRRRRPPSRQRSSAGRHGRRGSGSEPRLRRHRHRHRRGHAWRLSPSPRREGGSHVSTRLGGWPLLVYGRGAARARGADLGRVQDRDAVDPAGRAALRRAGEEHRVGRPPLVRGVPADLPSVSIPRRSRRHGSHRRRRHRVRVAKVINVVLMTAACMPTYFWARRLVPPVWAASAVALVLVMPSMLYTGVLMSENAFFPLFVAATFAWRRRSSGRRSGGRRSSSPVRSPSASGVQAIVLLAVLPGRDRGEGAVRRAAAGGRAGCARRGRAGVLADLRGTGRRRPRFVAVRAARAAARSRRRSAPTAT